MGEFLTGNEWYWRLARTIAQGVIGVLVANLDLIVGWCVLDPSVRALVVALVMAVLSPVMAELGERGGDVPAIPRGGE
jgi:multisubunit Na+/H+ antiporter MnhG subunit